MKKLRYVIFLLNVVGQDVMDYAKLIKIPSDILILNLVISSHFIEDI